MMSVQSTYKPRRKARTVTEAITMAGEKLEHDFATLTKEQMAEKLTTYIPGIPHCWFGRPVEPLTAEELLEHWNGGPEPEIRYKDVPGYTPSRYMTGRYAEYGAVPVTGTATMPTETVAK